MCSVSLSNVYSLVGAVCVRTITTVFDMVCISKQLFTCDVSFHLILQIGSQCFTRGCSFSLQDLHCAKSALAVLHARIEAALRRYIDRQKVQTSAKALTLTCNCKDIVLRPVVELGVV